MTCLVFCEGLLEPVEIDQPFQAVVTILDTGMQSGKSFFVDRNPKGEYESIAIAKIIHITEVKD